MNEQRPIVSVIVLTYNHEKHIRQALDSILMQKTDFPFEILVGDDASTDGTPKILEEYSRCSNLRIRVFLRSSNLGASRNAYELLKQTRGDYLAFCEGDDYWLTEDKLQKQYDFLEKNSSYIGCCCRSLIVDPQGKPLRIQRLSWVKRKRRFTFRDYCGGKYLPGQTASVMKRNIFLQEEDDWSILYRANRNISDRISTGLYLLRGDFCCLDETMSAYRKTVVHGGNNLTSRQFKDNEHKCEEELAMTEAMEQYAAQRLGKPIIFHRKRADILLDAYVEWFRHRRQSKTESLEKLRRIRAAVPFSSRILLPCSIIEKAFNHICGS